jgi:hypothetical protein
VTPEIGQKYVYKHNEGKGLGAHHADGELSSEMAELDMKPGTEVVVVAENDKGELIVAWPDINRPDFPRHTSITADFFGEHFEAAQ